MTPASCSTAAIASCGRRASGGCCTPWASSTPPCSMAASRSGSPRAARSAPQPPAYPPATFTPRPRPELFVDKGAVLQAVDDPGVCLINTLTEPDFRGGEPSRYGRPGHIPKSVNLPWPDLTEPETNVLIPLDAGGAADRGARRRPGRAHRLLLRRRHLGDHGPVPAASPRLRQPRAVRRLDGGMGARRDAADRARLRRGRRLQIISLRICLMRASPSSIAVRGRRLGMVQRCA